MKKQLIYLSITALAFFACKKDTPGSDNDTDESGFANVLKDNSGFTQIYNASGAEINLSDFTVETNNNLNIVHYTIFRSQQDNFNRYSRKTVNLTTKETLPLPQYAFDVETYSPTAIRGYEKIKEVVLEAFKPYSNYFAYGTYLYGNSTRMYSSEIGGDFSGSASSFNGVGLPELGYYYPSIDVRGGEGYFGSGVPNPSYLYRVINFKQGAFINGTDKNLIISVLESRYSFNNNGSAMQFDISKNGMIAYEREGGDANYKKEIGQVAFSAIPTTAKVVRHYSADGKILVLLISNTESNKFWAVSYDFSTKTLSKLFENSSLAYGAQGSDVDCDEFGNLYYTGIADMGKNMTGVSVYKQDKSGVNTLIGTDNFLKFGEIIRLKSLHGKIYFALRGKITGSSDFQLSIVKQN